MPITYGSFGAFLAEHAQALYRYVVDVAGAALCTGEQGSPFLAVLAAHAITPARHPGNVPVRSMHVPSSSTAKHW